MNTLTVNERNIAGRKIKIGTSPVWEAIMDWFKTGKPSMLLNTVITEAGLAPLEPFQHELDANDMICVLPTTMGLFLYIPSDEDRMAMKTVVGPDGKEKRMPNYDAPEIGIAKKSSGGKTLSHSIPWSSPSLETIVRLLPKIIVGIESVLQNFDPNTPAGVRDAKNILSTYFDVQLNFLPQLCQFSAACVYLSGRMEAFEHSIIRYINGQFAAIELIRNRRCDNLQLRGFLTSCKEGGSDKVLSALFRSKTTPSGKTIISQLCDDFTLCAEVKQGCALKLTTQRMGRVNAGDFDIVQMLNEIETGPNPPVTTPIVTAPSNSSPAPVFKPRRV